MSNENKDAPLNNFYPFKLVRGEVITYLFQTNTGVKYEVKFKHSPYIFLADFPFSKLVFEFSLLLGYKPPGNPKIASDQLIPLTVVAIFLDFYKRFNDNSLTVYICDSADFRQHVRKRKFDRWFGEYNDGTFVKVDEEIKDIDGTTYPVAIIMKRSNPYRVLVFEEFVKLTDSYNDDK